MWDAIFTAKGIWGFNDKYVTGVTIFNLPVEEVMFFICIPFSCIFTYHSITKYFDLNWKGNTGIIIVSALSAVLIITGLANIERSYTFFTFVSTGILLILFKFVYKVNWLEKFLSVYLILLIPFLIVNGILTGTGLEEPVVWYDNSQNLGIRILTIPIEDSVYGFELLMLTMFFYEKFKIRFAGKS